MQHIATASSVKVEKSQITKNTRLLSLYYEPPQQELTLDEFEMLSLDRLQLLRGLEALKNKGFEEHDFNSKLFEVNDAYIFCWSSLIFCVVFSSRRSI